MRVQGAEVELGAYEGAVVVANEPEVPEPSEATLRVYPNPASSFLTVATETEEITILDVLGRVALRTKATERIDVSDLPAGVYVVRANGQTRTFTKLQ